jgi:secreted trypsin-like serine protease
VQIRLIRLAAAGLPLTALLVAGALSTGADAITGRQVKIIGGSVAAPGQFPWMVALVDPRARNAADGQFCGGTVIAPLVVLTAAHCVYGSTARWTRSSAARGSPRTVTGSA